MSAAFFGPHGEEARNAPSRTMGAAPSFETRPSAAPQDEGGLTSLPRWRAFRVRRLDHGRKSRVPQVFSQRFTSACVKVDSPATTFSQRRSSSASICSSILRAMTQRKRAALPLQAGLFGPPKTPSPAFAGDGHLNSGVAISPAAAARRRRSAAHRDAAAACRPAAPPTSAARPARSPTRAPAACRRAGP